ncbi:MAG TPA: AmpG family muropeptide MFS transporter [Bacteroidota bacterium]
MSDEANINRKRKVEWRNPWTWVPTLYFAEGIPYFIVMTVSVIMYKRMGISNADIAWYTSWLYLPWIIKPLWSPIVDMFKTKRFWIVTMQLVLGIALACVALTIPLPGFFQFTLAVFWLMAFSSATHDIAADGFYMLALSDHHQAAFVGVRSTFYRVASLVGQGGLVVLAGSLEESTGSIPFAWSVTFFTLGGVFLCTFFYHQLILPSPQADQKRSPGEGRSGLQEFFAVFMDFMRKPGIGLAIAYMLLYRFAEAQLVKLASPFLLDAQEKGGLGLTTSEVGFVYGTVGVAALTIGGLLGGWVVSRQGLKFWLWPMVVMINVPDAVYIFLSATQPTDLLIVNAAVAVEQFGYGFGFTAFLLYMILVSDGKYKTAHYALCTGFMAIGMMVPGLFSGFIQEYLGYQNFFIWIMISTIPAFVVTSLIKIDPAFGRKT